MPDAREHDVELAETFAAVARVLLEDRGVGPTLERICHLAVQTVDGCETAGVSIVEGSRITSRTTTDDLPLVVDEIQSDTQEGPCIDAIKESEVFITGSLSEERRWPKFAARAHEATGIESILSLRLFAREDTMGSLNLYSTRRDAFDEQDVAVGSVFAAHAAVALSSARREAQLAEKVDSREVIGMAIGMIMGQHHATEAEAFDILRRASQRTNVKLRDVASQVVQNQPKKSRED